jgi:hypothetical protein
MFLTFLQLIRYDVNDFIRLLKRANVLFKSPVFNCMTKAVSHFETLFLGLHNVKTQVERKILLSLKHNRNLDAFLCEEIIVALFLFNAERFINIQRVANSFLLSFLIPNTITFAPSSNIASANLKYLSHIFLSLTTTKF